MLGAQGVQVGTRFLVAKECTVHQNYKDKILNAKDIDTMVTGRTTGHPVRVLKNKIARQYQLLEKENASIERLEELGKGALPRAAREGDVMMGSVMAGQIAGLVKCEQSAKEMVTEMFMEAESVIKNLQEGYFHG